MDVAAARLLHRTIDENVELFRDLAATPREQAIEHVDSLLQVPSPAHRYAYRNTRHHSSGLQGEAMIWYASGMKPAAAIAYAIKIRAHLSASIDRHEAIEIVGWEAEQERLATMLPPMC